MIHHAHSTMQGNRSVKHPRYHWFAAVLLLLVPRATADLTLTSGQLSVVLMEDRCYTFGNIYRKGRLFCEGATSGQGIVLKMDTVEGEWAGSIHGHEKLLETRLTVDGQPMEMEQDRDYTGDSIEFYRRTIIASAMVVQSTVRLTEDRIEETVSLQGISPESECIGCFVFLGSRFNRLTDYAGFSKYGRILSSGQLSSDDNNYTYLKPAVAVAQFDPALGDGLVAALTQGDTLDPLLYLWDRPYDNKLYCRIYGAQRKCDFENFYLLKMVTRFFDAEPQTWTQRVRGILAEEYCSEALSADIHRDCRVDLQDLAALAEQWLACRRLDADLCP
jgi:hypothetical protein